MGASNEFDIKVEYKEDTLFFHIKIIDRGTDIKAEVWKEGKHYFSLTCWEDIIGDTFKLAPTFDSAGIDPELARIVGYRVESEME